MKLNPVQEAQLRHKIRGAYESRISELNEQRHKAVERLIYVDVADKPNSAIFLQKIIRSYDADIKSQTTMMNEILELVVGDE